MNLKKERRGKNVRKNCQKNRKRKKKNENKLEKKTCKKKIFRREKIKRTKNKFA